MKTLLIFENDTDTVDIITSLYEYSTFNVVKSARKLSIDEIAHINPNIIILDHLLDDGFGGDLCLEIKMNSSTKHIPIILYSASNHVEQLATTNFANAFISKPFDLYYFIDMVNLLAL
ncbi:response regulator [Mucilaginibacter gotjawali]|uniref:DNA-binding response OmpR family regulator n=1 Tax=Mucilaginibacter gotjawali TaxID=1550579 RepID=A0A839SCQ3_9SPHI|nr:response regulator [Mucilaginibacter gotjawali]MBB3055368.1 DNA-binding response OmpR family regulator [Mucilaginibacter gotjawali]